MKKLFLLALTAAVLATTGCIDTTTMVSVNRDGSGHVAEITYMSAQALGMMGGMMGGLGDGAGADADANPLMDEDQARAKAAQLGEGVTFVSIKELTKPDGSKGAQVLYKFADVNKLKVEAGGKDMGGGMGGPGMGAAAAPAAKKTPITFSYTTGKLTVNLPWDEAGQAATVAAAGNPATSPQEKAVAKQMMAGMVPMFKGLRMRLLVKVPNEIKRTNASYATVGAAKKKRQYVTLLDFNMDTLLEAEGGMGKFMELMELQDTADEAKAMQLLADVPGIKVEQEKQVTIEF